MSTAKKLHVNRDHYANEKRHHSNLKLVHGLTQKLSPAARTKQLRWSMVWGSALLATAFLFGASGFMDLGSFYSETVYFSLWITLAVGWSAFHELYKRDFEFSLKSPYAGPALIGLALTTFIFYAVGTASRAPVEEAYWLSVSQTMHQIHGLGNARGPALFPFLASLCHSLFGYEEHHVLWVNFLASFALLTLLLRIGDRVVRDRAYGVLSAALLVSFPLFGILVTSNNPDFLNTALLLGAAYQLYRTMEEPTLVRWELAVTFTLLAAQCRASSILFLLPIFAAGYQNRRTLLAETATLRTILLPLLCIPVICLVSANQLMANQFDANYFTENFGEAVTFFLNPKSAFPLSSQLFTLLAFAGFALMASQWQRFAKHHELPMRALGFICAGIAAITIGQYSFEQGDIHNFLQTRLVLIYLPLLALAATYPLFRFYRRGAGAPIIALLVIANLCYQIPNHSRRVGIRPEVRNELQLNRVPAALTAHKGRTTTQRTARAN